MVSGRVGARRGGEPSPYLQGLDAALALFCLGLRRRQAALQRQHLQQHMS